MRGDLSEAVELIDHGLALAKDDGERLQLLIEKARYLGEVGNFDEAAALLDRCEGLNDDHDRAKEIAIERAKIAMSWDDLDAAHRYVQGLGDVRSLPEPAGYEGASLIAGLAATEGRLADAATWAAVAQELADESGRASRQLTARRHTALVLLFSGRVREAQELTRHVFDRYVELGYRKGIIETGVNLLYTSRWTGDLLEARACGERVMETKPDPLWGATALTNISEIEYELGNIEAAEELALRAIEMPESSLTWARVSAHLQLARFALSRGDASTAREHANAGRGTPALAEHSLRAETMLMEAAILADRPSEAREHWTSAQALVTDVSPVLRADEERRLILASDLSVDEMTTALEGLLTRVQDAGLRLEEARTLLSLGVLIAPLRERYFADAEKLFSDTACARGLEELAAMSS
jgi:tetratricopeptide (TPR) repeat protein